MASYSISEARPVLGDLVRRAAGHERITISEHRRPVAVVIGLHELRELEARAARGDLAAEDDAGGATPSRDAARAVADAA